MAFDRTNTEGNVCVVGTGVTGLGAIKNLLEVGFSVTAYEKNECIGGLWHVSKKPARLSALPGSRFNTSKYCTSFTDFPMPENYPDYPSARQVDKYLNAYAKQFDLFRHIVFSTEATTIRRNELCGGWDITTKDAVTGLTQSQTFDRVVITIGMLNKPHSVNLTGLEKFTGEALHSQEFKDPSRYVGKSVLVVGMGSTAADIACFLKRAGVRKVFISHRGTFQVMPRYFGGRPTGDIAARRSFQIIRFIARISPSLCAFILTRLLQLIQDKSFPHLKLYGKACQPRRRHDIVHRHPFVSDDFPQYLQSTSVQMMREVREIIGPKSVLFSDGQEVDEVDAIILCTGYRQDLSIIKGTGRPDDPSGAPDGFQRLEAAPFHNPDSRFFRLYHGILSEKYPMSLAVIGHLWLFPKTIIQTSELASMALAALWSGDCAQPTTQEMSADIDSHYDFVVRTVHDGPIVSTGLRLDSSNTYRWLNDVAGTGVCEYIESWSWKGWKYWWHNRHIHWLLLHGPDVPAVYRLLDLGRGRKPWAGARNAIMRANVGYNNDQRLARDGLANK